MPTSLFFMQIIKKYLHLQQMSVLSRHMAKVDFFFPLLSCMWVDPDLDSTLPHQQKIRFLNKKAYLYETVLCTLLSFCRYGFFVLFFLISHL